MLRKLSFIVLAIAVSSVSIFAQDAQIRTLAGGQKYKIKGIVVSKIDDSTLIVRDSVGVDTKVVIQPNASIKNNSFFGGDRYQPNTLIRGLSVEVEGSGDNMGNLSARKVRFDRSDLEVAQAIDSRVSPAEDRLSAAEENAQRVSGQIDELMAISNAAKGGAKAAQETADAAVAGVNATNKRFTDLDDYVVQSAATINFRVNSATLSAESKAALDEVASATTSLKGYVIEVTGFASSEGNTKKNKMLSERRAQAVKDYLIETHNLPLRRFTNSYGFGALQAVADNSTREGREQNRRVEVKLLVSRGINQSVEVKSQTDDQ